MILIRQVKPNIETSLPSIQIGLPGIVGDIGLPVISQQKPDFAPRPALSFEIHAKKKRKPKKSSRRVPPPNQPVIKLRPYQEKIISEFHEAVRHGENRILILIGGGAGKTVIASWIMRTYALMAGIGQATRRSVFIVDRTVLIEQTADKVGSLNVVCATLQGKGDLDKDAPIAIVSAQTIEARLRKGQTLEQILGVVTGTIFVDEAHIGAFREVVKQTAAHYIEKHGAVYCGLTASPQRLSAEEYLGQEFDYAIEGVPIPELVRMGNLSPAKYVGAGNALDLSNLETGRDGDYVDSQVERLMAQNEDYAIDQWKKNCLYNEDGTLRKTPRRTVVFCSTVASAKTMAEKFCAAGYAADYQDGNSSEEERADHDSKLRSGELSLVCCCNTLIAGWDMPEIECVLFFRISKSIALFFQAAWRGSRPCPEIGKKRFILIDIGGNLKRLGFPMEETDYYIGPPKYKPDASDASLEKTCPSCQDVISIFLGECPTCGHSFKKEDEEEEPQPGLLAEDLVELFSPAQKKKILGLRLRKKECYREGLIPELAVREFYEEYKFAPQRDWHYGAVFGSYHGATNRRKYQRYLLQLVEDHPSSFAGKDEEDVEYWVQAQMDLEFLRPNSIKESLDKSWKTVLGVQKGDTKSVVRNKYVALAREFHSDVTASGDHAVMTPEEATARMSQINDAWEKAKKFFESKTKKLKTN